MKRRIEYGSRVKKKKKSSCIWRKEENELLVSELNKSMAIR